MLACDDEPFNLKSIKIIFKSAMRYIGRNPLFVDELLDTASDGNEAVEAVIRAYEMFGIKYSLILLDLSMP